MLTNINEQQDKRVEEFLDNEISNFKNNFIYEKKLLGIKQKNKDIKCFQLNQKDNNIYFDSNINNKIKYLKYEFITYNDKSGEIINNTIHALNTGLKYFPETPLKQNKIINMKSNDKIIPKFFPVNKAKINSRARKEKLSKNTIRKNIDLRKILNNKEENKIKNIKSIFRNKSFNDNKQIKNLTNERKRKINFCSLVQNNSTFEENNKTNKIDKTQSINSINMKDNQKFNNKNFIYIRNNKINDYNSKTQTINNEIKEKFKNIKTECLNTKKKINNLKQTNNIIQFRINEINNKFQNFERMKNTNSNNQINLKYLENEYKWNEEVKMKQKKLIQNILNNIEDAKININEY